MKEAAAVFLSVTILVYIDRYNGRLSSGDMFCGNRYLISNAKVPTKLVRRPQIRRHGSWLKRKLSIIIRIFELVAKYVT